MNAGMMPLGPGTMYRPADVIIAIKHAIEPSCCAHCQHCADARPTMLAYAPNMPHEVGTANDQIFRINVMAEDSDHDRGVSRSQNVDSDTPISFSSWKPTSSLLPYLFDVPNCPELKFRIPCMYQ